jgi:hypothetical protein
MSDHNETCGCAECGNYGQVYNPHAIHNQSCGCAKCGNYPQTGSVLSKVAESEHTESKKSTRSKKSKKSTSEDVMVVVPVELLEEVHALIGRPRGTAS